MCLAYFETLKHCYIRRYIVTRCYFVNHTPILGSENNDRLLLLISWSYLLYVLLCVRILIMYSCLMYKLFFRNIC